MAGGQFAASTAEQLVSQRWLSEVNRLYLPHVFSPKKGQGSSGVIDQGLPAVGERRPSGQSILTSRVMKVMRVRVMMLMMRMMMLMKNVPSRG